MQIIKRSWLELFNTQTMKKYSFIVALLPILFFIACTSTFNWREVRFDEEQYMALFPAKNAFEQQTIRFEDHRLTMTMAAAKAGEILFAIGTIPIDTKIVSGEALVQWMRLNTAKLIKESATPQIIQFEIKTAGSPVQILSAQGYNLKGLGPDGNYRIYWVRWVTRTNESGQSRIYQLSAIKSFKSVPSANEQKQIIEQFETFMSGFRPY